MFSVFFVVLISNLVNILLSSPQNDGKLSPPSFIINILKNNTHPVNENLKKEVLLKPNSAVITCISNERVTSPNHFQDTRLIKLTLENLRYDPGDVLIVRPQNSNKAVDDFFKIFKNRKDEISENHVIEVTKRQEDVLIPYVLREAVIFRNVVKEYFTLNMIPKKYTFEILSHFTDDEKEREKLSRFASANGTKEFFEYCVQPKRTILEVFEDFPGAAAKIPVDYLFEVFQPIRPRTFSVASSGKIHKGEIHLLVAVVESKTNLNKTWTGLCSSWLASLKSGDKIAVFLGKGLFTFPKQADATVIMIGPGTGIAPFRSYAFDMSLSEETNKTIVFFGCRSKTADFYFADDWQNLQNRNKVRLFTAFSRDQPQKIYVQHLIEKNAYNLCKLITHQNASIFVAGNALKMPQQVRNTFVSGYSKFQNVSQESAEDFFDKMKQNGRYQIEVW